MGKKGLKEAREEIVECENCNGIISIAVSLKRGAVVCCEECDAEYSLNSRRPLTLELLEDDEENIYDMLGAYDTDDDDFNVGDYGYGDDDYDDGRYD